MAALTESMYANSTRGSCSSQLFWSSLTTIASLNHRVAYTFYPTVAFRVVGAGGNFSNTERLIYGVRTLGSELEAVVREDTARASQARNLPVDKNVSRAFSGELCRSDGVHVGSAAETIIEMQDVGISS